ncbi:hypothetical protein [Streptomyces sp. NPDC054958]
MTGTGLIRSAVDAELGRPEDLMPFVRCGRPTWPDRTRAAPKSS